MEKSKKIKYTIIICFTLIFMTCLGVIYANNVSKGDINNDGEINDADITLLKMYLIHRKESIN